MKCTVCSKEVEYPNWMCSKQPGKHTVESKTYYHSGSGNIADVRDRRKFSPYVFLKSDSNRVDAEGQIISDAPVAAQFSDAMYTTSDPEEQFYLERSRHIQWGESGQAMWRKNQLTSAQQIDVQKAELELVQRQLKEGNELLAKVKAQQESANKPAAGK